MCEEVGTWPLKKGNVLERYSVARFAVIDGPRVEVGQIFAAMIETTLRRRIGNVQMSGGSESDIVVLCERDSRSAEIQ